MFFERHSGGERAILVHLDGQDPEAREDPQEFRELALSAGADIVSFVNVPRHRPTAKYLVGSGKVEELRDLVKAEEVRYRDFQSRPYAQSGTQPRTCFRVSRA